MTKKTALFRKICNSFNNRNRILLSCHPEDLKMYAKELRDDIERASDFSIYILEDATYIPEDPEDYYAQLSEFSLLVFPVTARFLTEENRARDIDYRFALDKHIPVLPVIVEPGLYDLFNQFSQTQALDKTTDDSTQDSYDVKLKKHLNSLFVDEETVNKIKNAFNAYIFLSYRKKDRKYVKEVMSLIHENEFMRDTAIWYDEFLTPGEDFNDEIADNLIKSRLMMLLVTPNINEKYGEKGNYVMDEEYPSALRENKPVLPIEVVPTDHDDLKKNYKDINKPIRKEEADKLTAYFKNIFSDVESVINGDDAEHLYYIGLAYLNGIDVERDFYTGANCVYISSKKKYLPAIKKMVSVYSELLVFDYAARAQKEYIDICEEKGIALSENEHFTYADYLRRAGFVEEATEYVKKNCAGVLKDPLTAPELYADVKYLEAKSLQAEAYGLLKECGTSYEDTIIKVNNCTIEYLNYLGLFFFNISYSEKLKDFSDLYFNIGERYLNSGNKAMQRHYYLISLLLRLMLFEYMTGVRIIEINIAEACQNLLKNPDSDLRVKEIETGIELEKYKELKNEFKHFLVVSGLSFEELEKLTYLVRDIAKTHEKCGYDDIIHPFQLEIENFEKGISAYIKKYNVRAVKKKESSYETYYRQYEIAKITDSVNSLSWATTNYIIESYIAENEMELLLNFADDYVKQITGAEKPDYRIVNTLQALVKALVYFCCFKKAENIYEKYRESAKSNDEECLSLYEITASAISEYRNKDTDNKETVFSIIETIINYHLSLLEDETHCIKTGYLLEEDIYLLARTGNDLKAQEVYTKYVEYLKKLNEEYETYEDICDMF